MKLEVRSLRVPWSRKRDRLRFFGKKTILNVHETGFTIEGLIPEVWFPILMRLIFRLVSDWSMRSIPFSRIRTCKVRSRKGLRLVVSLVVLGLVALIFKDTWNQPYIYYCVLAASFGLTFWLSSRLFKDCVDLEYETKESRRCLVRIRFRNIRDQMLMFQELSRHRLDVTAPDLAKVAQSITQRRSLFSFRRNRGEDC